MTCSKNVRNRILRRIYRGSTITHSLSLDNNIVTRRTVERWIASGQGLNPPARNRIWIGRVTEEDFVVLLNWLHKNPRRTYNQMADFLWTEANHLYTNKQIFGAMRRRHVERKKIQVIAMQRDEAYRREFRKRLRSPERGALLFEISSILSHRIKRNFQVEYLQPDNFCLLMKR